MQSWIKMEGNDVLKTLKGAPQQITRCMRFAMLTQIAPLRSATSHTPEPLGDMSRTDLEIERY